MVQSLLLSTVCCWPKSAVGHTRSQVNLLSSYHDEETDFQFFLCQSNASAKDTKLRGGGSNSSSSSSSSSSWPCSRPFRLAAGRTQRTTDRHYNGYCIVEGIIPQLTGRWQVGNYHLPSTTTITTLPFLLRSCGQTDRQTVYESMRL